MDKLNMRTTDIVSENVEKIAAMFPNAVTEAGGKRVIDFDILRQELMNDIVEGREERYEFSWPDKRKAIRTANTPISGTLRPCLEESKDFENTENLYIEGDNLDVLKLLRKTYLNKIKMIYIDPPYNTGDDIIYKNNFQLSQNIYDGVSGEVDSYGNILARNTDSNGRFHTDWLNMMYPRLKISRDILSDDGLFAIAIDHNELFNLGKMCDEVFGMINRIGIIAVVHKPEGRNQAKFIGPSHEYLFIYAKNIENAKLRKVAISEEQAERFCFSDEKGSYQLKNFIRLADGKYSLKENKPTFWYPIFVSENLQKMSLEFFEGAISIYPVTETGIERTWKTTKETFLKRYNDGDIIAKYEGNSLKIFEKLKEDEVIKTHWIDKKYHGFHFGTKVLDELLGVKTFDFPKSLFLIRDILKLTTEASDTILDFFSGSATTAHAVMQLNAEDGGGEAFHCSAVA